MAIFRIESAASLVIGSVLIGQVAVGQVLVSEQSEAVGIEHVQNVFLGGFPTGQSFPIAGGAAGDFNNDGWPDLFVPSAGVECDKLFINQKDGTFIDQALQWGLNDIYCGSGAAAGDFNDDGWLDIYVTSFGNGNSEDPDGPEVGTNRLYRNSGEGTFTEIAAQAGVNYTSYTQPTSHGANWGDYDLDGDLDLFVAAWAAIAEGNRLYRNNGDETFTDVTVSSGVFGPDSPELWGFQGSFSDMNEDGYPDLLVSADFESSRYYQNDGDGTFTDITAEAGLGLDDNGMGQAIGDYNLDGLFDWYVTSIFQDNPPPGLDPGNMLYIQQAIDVFEEISVEASVNDGGWGWGTVAVDLDHDGLEELIEINGRPSMEWNNEQARLYYNNGDLTFTDIADQAGLDSTTQGRGISIFDYDRDGDMDLVFFSSLGPLELFRNQSPRTGAYLHVKFDTSTNPRLAPNGFGAKVTATVGGQSYIRYVSGHPTYLATGELAEHIGLGDAEIVDQLRIDWPRGYVTTMENVAVNQHLTMTAPSLGDLDGNGITDSEDRDALLAHWGPIGGAASDKLHDLNNNGQVDGADLGLLLGDWGR